MQYDVIYIKFDIMKKSAMYCWTFMHGNDKH